MGKLVPEVSKKMAKMSGSRVPGRDEPDPENIRQRSFQGGTDSLPDRPTSDQTYGQMKYEDGQGPFANTKLPNGAGSGLSGLPQANAGAAPALFNSEESAPAPEGQRQ